MLEEIENLNELLTKFKDELKEKSNDTLSVIVDDFIELDYSSDSDGNSKKLVYDIETSSMSDKPKILIIGDDRTIPMIQNLAALESHDLLIVSLEDKGSIETINDLHHENFNDMIKSMPKIYKEPEYKEVDNKPWYEKGKRSKKSRRLHKK